MDQSKLVVIKVGSQLVSDNDLTPLVNIALQIDRLILNGFHPVLISSGAVAMGKYIISHSTGSTKSFVASRDIDKRVAASVGQDEIISRWKQSLNHSLGQVLVDREHLSHRQAFVHTLKLIEKMLSLNILPVINENDALNLEGKKLGNNDLLAAYISNMLGASRLILVTEVGGIFEDYPANQKLIHEFDLSDPELLKFITTESSLSGTGGMASKLQAAEIVSRKGTQTLVVNHDVDFMAGIKNEPFIGTRIIASRPLLSGQKLWLSETSCPKGIVSVDPGASRALLKDKASLLFPGVREVTGTFDVHQVVEIKDSHSGQTVGKGVSRLSSSQIMTLLNSSDAEKQKVLDALQLMGDKGLIVIHRNQFVAENLISE